MNREEIIEAGKKHLFPAITTMYESPLILASGKDRRLWDIEGREYLDFFGGILTVSIGNCDEEVTEAIIEQARTLQHCPTIYRNEALVRFAAKLASIAPGGLEKCFFTNSGTEANETAILAVRIASGRQEIITLRHSYHGRSTMTMAATGDAGWKIGGAESPGFRRAHNAYCYRCPFGASYPGCDLRCAKDVEDLIRTDTCGSIAGFIAEPMQGVGGFITPPKEYFPIVYDIVKKYGGLCISDEVQAGFGRTGTHWWGIDHYDVTPDVITCAKGIANGTPCGATVATDQVACAVTGKSISTFGGNPVTSAAATATIERIERDKLINNASRMGLRLREGLEALKEKYSDVIGDIRGIGLMQAIELAGKKKEPLPEITARLLECTRENGLLIGKAGVYNNVIRLAPQLTVDKNDIGEALDILDRSFSKAVAEGPNL